MNKFLIILFAAISFYSCETIPEFNPVSEQKTLPIVEAQINPEDYQMLLENRFGNTNVSVRLLYNGNLIDGNIEGSGAGSRFFPKWSYSLTTLNGVIENENTFNLSAQVYDRSFTKTTLASYIFREMGFPVFNSSEIFLILNNKNKGVYKLIERIDDNFFIKRQLPVYELIKVRFEAKFSMIGQNNIYTNFDKEIPDDNNLNNLAEFFNALDTISSENLTTQLGHYLDIKNYLKYHAVSTIIASVDGFTNNMYLYRSSSDSAYQIIPWDFDRSFDSQFKPIIYGDNEIIRKLKTNSQIDSIYRNELRYICNEIFTEENLFPIVDTIYNRIKEAYYLDPHLGLAGYNLDEDIAAIKQFIVNRRRIILDNL
jgi:spore coat protein H